MINVTKKWIFLKLSGAILIPLMLWFILSLNAIYDQEYIDIVNFFTNSLLNSSIGKFIILGIIWSFSFQILSEIRHLIMDLGYGFELKTTKITGLIVIFGSIILTVILYLSGKIFF